MTKGKKLVAVLLPIGIVCVLVIFFVYIYTWTPPGLGPCGRAASDARNIAAAIADYFAIPEHTDVKPSDLKYLQLNNPWTFTKCGDEIIILVFDREMKCPFQGEYNGVEWNSHLAILRFR
jgi:hypothetical protein